VAVEALEAHALSSNGLPEDEDVSIVALFDHEEVGSGSNAGLATLSSSCTFNEGMRLSCLSFAEPDLQS